MPSQSMVPLILPKDKPIVSRGRPYELNDIVVFKKRNRLIAHRIIYVPPDKKFFITKGDNNLTSDGKIGEDEILGKVTRVKRGNQVVDLSHLYLAQSFSYLKALKEVVKELNSEKIPFIVLKGLPLHIFYRGQIPQRLYVDVDILVKAKDFEKVTKILGKEGFVVLPSRFFWKRIEEPSQTSFVKVAKPFPIEIDLHKEATFGFAKAREINRLLPSEDIFSRYLFKNIRKIKVDGISFPVLKTYALCLYLLLHLFRHNFKGPHRFELLDTILRKEKIDWEELSNKLSLFEFNNFVYPAFLILKALYKTPIPRRFVRDVSPGLIVRIFASIIAKRVDPFSRRGRAFEGSQKAIFVLFLSHKSMKDKLGVLLSRKTFGYFLGVIKFFFSRVFKNSSTSASALSGLTRYIFVSFLAISFSLSPFAISETIANPISLNS